MILARHIAFLVLKQQVHPTSYYLKVNFDQGQRVKRRVISERVFSETLCKSLFHDMFVQAETVSGCATKISMSVSNFSYQKRKPLSLLSFSEDYEAYKLSQSLQKLREKYSIDVVKSGSEM